LVNDTTILLFTALALSILFIVLANWYCDKRERLFINSYRKRIADESTTYRIHVISNGIRLVGTVGGKNYSEAFNEAIAYSFEQADALPDALTLIKDEDFF